MEINVCDIEVGDILKGIISDNTVEVLEEPWYYDDDGTHPRWVLKARIIDNVERGERYRRYRDGDICPKYTVGEGPSYYGTAYNVRLVKKNNEIKIPQYITPFSL